MNCSTNPLIGFIKYGEFSKRIHDKASKERIPLTGSIELTYRCNLSCKHCYVNLANNDERAINNELSTDQWFKIIDEIVKNGCLWLLFTGGEPFLRHDFIEIYLYAKSKGLIITIFTNGTLLTPDIASVLANHKPFSVGITLYGHTETTNEAVTGSADVLFAAHQGIDLLLKNNISVELKTTLSSINAHEIDLIKKWAHEKGIIFKYDLYLNPRIDGQTKPLEVRLSPEQAVAIDLNDEKRYCQWKDLLTKYSDITDMNYIFPCGAGINGFHIDPYGNLNLCMMVRNPALSIADGGFSKGWNEFLFNVRMKKKTKAMKCDDCKIHILCDQCPGWAAMENNDPETVVSYLCKVANLRYNRLTNYI